MANVLSILLDTSQPRLWTDCVTHVVSGLDWDLSLSSPSIGIEPITHTAMLLPTCFAPEWGSVSGGLYQRLTKADFILTTPSAWREFDVGFEGNRFLHAINTNEIVSTSQSWERNRGIFLSWFAYNWGGEVASSRLECGWGTPGTDLSFRFWSSSVVEVWSGTVLLGQGSLSSRASYRQRGEEGGPADQNPASSLTARLVSVVILPYRRREVLILSPTEGGGFNFLLETISHDTPDPQIHAPGPFWLQVVSGQATFQVAPVQFFSAGTLISRPLAFDYAPLSSQPVTITPFWDKPGFGSVSVGTALLSLEGTAFSYGTADVGRVGVILNGDGIASPFVYGASLYIAGSALSTYAANQELVSYTLSSPGLSMRVGEDLDSLSASFLLHSPQALEGSVAPKLRTISNRPIKILLDGVGLMDGLIVSTRQEKGIEDRADRVIVECEDRWRSLQEYRFREEFVLDGMNLAEAFKFLVKVVGFSDADLDIGAIDFDLSGPGQESEGEWSFKIEVGDTPAEWITRLWQTYHRTAFVGWFPRSSGILFTVKTAEQIGNTPLLTLYDSIYDAGGNDSRVLRSLSLSTIEPEANDIWVVGWDPRRMVAIRAHLADIDSQAPDTPPSSRPDNWLGELRRYGLVDASIVSESVASYVAAVLYERLGKVRRLAEWQSDFLVLESSGVPVWKGDVVRLAGYGDYRILSLDSSWTHSSSSRVWRPTTYVGEKIG